MMTFILGGSASGKSEFAESYTDRISKGKQKYYIATMHASDEESKKKIQRHRRLRAGKEFVTIEQPTDIGEAVRQMKSVAKTALLECLSNLVANEMFSGQAAEREEIVTEKIVQGIKTLVEQVDHLVVVSNNIFEDGIVYEDTTMAYVRALGRLNGTLAELADEVTEVVVGIPVTVKRRNHLCGF